MSGSLLNRSSVRERYLVDLRNYTVINKLKSGGYGKIFLIRDKKTNKELAAKILPVKEGDELEKKMISREIGIMMLLHHLTFVQFYGYSLTDFDGKNNVTIIMNLAKNGSLATLLQNVQKGLANTYDITYDNTARQKILIGIARGMMYLHQHRIIHRDLKPDNILLDEFLLPHITDFGLSKIFEYGQSQNQSHAYGTSIYMAPEVIRGDSYNGKADVYSFGILMFEVLTDTIPYPLFQNKKMSPFLFNNKIVSEKYRPEFTVPVKEPLKQLIVQCWSDDPSERPTFEEIFNKLAFSREESVYDVFESDDEYKYYLEDVDVDEVLDFAMRVSQNEMSCEDSENQEQIRSLKAKNDELCRKLKNDEKIMKRLADDNEKLKQENKEMKQNITKLFELVEKLSNQPKYDKYESPPRKESHHKYDKYESPPRKETHHKYESPPKIKDVYRKFDCGKGDELNGIMRYLYNKAGGNVHYMGIIDITSNSYEKHNPGYIGDFDLKRSYYSKNEEGAYVCFDFEDRSIQLSSYTIRASDCSHLKNWDVLVSNDKCQWITIDSRRDNQWLNGKNWLYTFSVQRKDYKFYRYIQILSKGVSCNKLGNQYEFGINCVDFFGELRE